MMNGLLALLRREPALVGGLVSAVVSLVIAFGVKLSADQIGAIMAVVAALTGFIVRTQVAPTAPANVPAPPPAPSGGA